jgi:hypothetical protein
VEVVPNLASYGNFAVASDRLYFEAGDAYIETSA